MIHWAFDLRSSDSDMEDEYDPDSSYSDTLLQSDSNQSTQQKQTERALEELFGTADDEVEYKPNPWSIARINAHARKILPPTKPRTKPHSKPNWKPSEPERPWNECRSSPRDSDTKAIPNIIQPPHPRSKPLRDSISEALRKAGSIPLISTEQEIIPEKHRDMEWEHKGHLRVSAPEVLVSAGFDQYLGDSDTFGCNLHPETPSRGCGVRDFSAYILNDHTITRMPNQVLHTVNDGEHTNQHTRVSSHDEYPVTKFITPNVNSEDLFTPNNDLGVSILQVCYETSGDGSPRTPMRPRLRPYCDNTPTDLRAPLEPERERKSRNQVHLGLPYSGSSANTKPEPSPTVQLIAKFAVPNPNVPTPVSRYSEHSDPDVGCEDSPTLTRLRSPTIEKPIPDTHPDLIQSYPSDTPKRRSRKLQNNRPTTPLSSKPTNGFDPDDKPFWSSLPTPPNSKPRHPTNGIKTSRFQLPGSFLESSPLSGSTGRTLYKPPPRKRARSPEDEDDRVTKWKVTRIG